MCETFAAMSLSIDDDNVKLDMWKELCNAFKQSLSSNDINDLEDISDIPGKMSRNAKSSADKILKTSGDDTCAENVTGVAESTEDVDNTKEVENNQSLSDNSACDTQAENAMADGTSSLNQDDAQFSIDDGFEEFCDSCKSNILPKDSTQDNDADIGNSKDLTSNTDNPDTKDVNLELKEWTESTALFIDNSIKEFVTPDLEKWKFSTGLCSKRSGKLARVFNTDTPLFESGYNLLNCEFIDKDGNTAGVVNEFSEFWDAQYKLLTNDEANLKKVNINSLLDITKNAVVVPFAKENESGEIVTDAEIFNREKKYAKKYFRYYKDFTTSADDPGFDDNAYNAVVGSNEG